MSLADSLRELKANVAQCERLIESAHKIDVNGTEIFAKLDQEQITVAAFLNMFVAWERFLEASIGELMMGGPTICGKASMKYVGPSTVDDARQMRRGVARFFDFGNHDHVRKLVNLYFDQGYPYEPHLTGILGDLADFRTMRNASAHISSTTQTALEALALRIFGKPMIGARLYTVLTAIDPRSTTGGTVFVTYKDKLITAAELIAQG